MSLKKKMGLGIMSGALGLSLIGGGTWAAFNDVETIDNTFKAGTLDLVTNTDTLFDISNMKPGDHITKSLTLTNNGSLPIDEILLTGSSDNWENKGEWNTKSAFLSQFLVEVAGHTVTLADVAHGTNSQKITFEGLGVAALAPGASIDFEAKVTFKDDKTRKEGSWEYVQNKYQGEGATVNLRLEATQMPGEERNND